MEDREHRYWMQPKTYTEFVVAVPQPMDTESLYFTRNEWALLSCACGSVIRKLVKDA